MSLLPLGGSLASENRVYLMDWWARRRAGHRVQGVSRLRVS